jgi:hypothetical protein
MRIRVHAVGNRLSGLLLALGLMLGATACPSAAADSIAELAVDFVRIGLRLQNHDPMPFIYIGPPALRDEARAAETTLADLVTQLHALQQRLRVLPPVADAMARHRRQLLDERITAAITRGDILLGNLPGSFEQESRLIFGVQAPLRDEEYFRSVIARLEGIIPGEGDLAERVAAFRAAFVIPPDRLEPVMQRALDECRSRTRARLPLPDDERVTLSITSGKHWVGFADYQGGNHTIYWLNSDFPVYVERAIELGCHEAYPGHHVHAMVVEQELLKRRGWVEFSLLNLFSPMAVIAEGAASFAPDLVFSREERIEFERNVLLPLAGIDSKELDIYYHFIDLLDELNFARNEVARRYLYGGMPRAEAIEWLMAYGLESRPNAVQRLDFIDAQRSYVINYNYGKQLVREHVLRGANRDSDQAWKRFYQLLRMDLAPGELQQTQVSE